MQLVKGYQPLHNGSDDFGQENSLVMHIISLHINEDLKGLHLGEVLTII